VEHPGRLGLLSGIAPGPGRWRPAAGLLWRSFDDELVVYDDRSGDTHRLTPRSAAVFLALQPRDPMIETGTLDAEVIDGLARLGLVEPE
jgi:hypothetical protein